MSTVKKLSVVIPVYNEKSTILEILKRVENVGLNSIEKEVIIVDDRSIDGTRELLEGLREKYKIIFKEKNEGKGSAVKLGFLEAAGDFLIIQDADLEYDPKEYPELLRPMLEGDADAVFSSRFMSNKPHRVLLFWHQIGNQIVTTLSNMLTNLNLTDMESGYKAFNRKAIDMIKGKLSSNRFGIEPELTALVAKNNLVLYEVGISYYGRTYKEGKKINWKDGIAAVWHIIRYNIFK